MYITRRGSQRDHGEVSTTANANFVTWHSGLNAIQVTSYWVNDFSTNSQHDWTITISVDELRAMVNAAASAIGGDNSAIVADGMAPALTAMLRIATASAIQMTAKPKE